MKGGSVCFGEARDRVVCESRGGREEGDYSAGSLSTCFTVTLFVLGMGRD